jgi:integrase
MTAVRPGWVGPIKQDTKGKRPFYCEYAGAAGKKLRQKLGYTRDEARRAYAEFSKKVDSGTHTPNSTRTFGDVLDAYERRCEERHRLWVRAGKPNGKSREWLTGNSVVNTRKAIRRHVYPALAHVRLHELSSRDHLQPFINDLACRYASMPSVCYLVIKESLNLAVDTGWLAVSPLSTRKLSVPPPPKPKTSVPTIEEGRAMWLGIQERGPGEYRHTHINRVAMAALAMFGGMERGAVTALMWSDVVWTAGVINISRSWSYYDNDKGPKNEHRIRTIPMSAEIRASLTAVWERDGHPGDGYVFYSVTKGGGSRHSVYRQAGRCLFPAQIRLGYVEDGGKPRWSFHEMRHYAGSVWLEARADITDVSRMLGHSNTAITEKVYVHYFKKQEAERHRAITDRVSAMHMLPDMREKCGISVEDAEIIE